MAVGVVYRPGYINIEDFIKALTRSLDNTNLDKVETIILGDFNVDYSAKKSLTLLTETSKSTIDLILVNKKNKIVQCDVLNSGISDLNAIFCVRKGGVKKLLLEVLSVFQKL